MHRESRAQWFRRVNVSGGRHPYQRHFECSGVIDEMRPLFDRGESTVATLTRKAKKRRTDRGAGDE